MADIGATPPKVKTPKQSRPGRTWDFSLTLPGMISAVGAGALALTFFFVMGILIGRGYRPEADVPRLGQIMPRTEHGQLAEEQPLPTVLQAEELEYPDRLRVSPDKIMDILPPEPTPAAAPAPRPQPQAAVQPQAPAPQAAATPAAPQAQAALQPAAQAAPGDPVFDYVYQVASFRQRDMAQTLADKLGTAGLKAGVESGDVNGATWHRVQVFHHGTAASTETMRAALAKFGVDKPLLRKKTAR
ncbi:SPOR domain-containing protein [Pseudodesulfovibrio sp. F-1]|uniref:SPOR domain-containing protein n=1 Tax=Pseudodesulfovibrio alkaliphilus TaxID=2661613 RepID=A0A7K1KMC1_9BACT|nr:SPOR domain-containing protein [Pseudodesulfovibrio alkaliphilus]MUM77190.1 SPOR domain-containing protein [Pseudodesulfovibrio alkaliphilus]